jgi:amidase
MTDFSRIDLSSRRDFLKKVGATAVGIRLGLVTASEATGVGPSPDLTTLSATKLARLIADREVSALEVAEAHLKRIEEVNPKLNAIVQMDAERIRAEARQADKDLQRGVKKGPLHGVPFTIKDCLLTKGIITTNGCPELGAYVPKEDATVVKRLKEAGGILLGKTNVPEMCFGDTDNLVYGPTNNPYDLSYSPGGSSGGEAAIIAAGGSPLGVGTDIGGSIRDPSHSCGVAGIKPTSHRVPETGMLSTFPFAVEDWNAIGPMARYVEDLYLVLRVISGPDDIDPHTVPVELGTLNDVSIEGLRVAFFSDDGVATATKETQEAVERAARELKVAGLTVVKARPPCVAHSPDLWLRAMIPSWAVAMRYWQQEYARMAGSALSEKRSPFTEFLLKALDLAHKKGSFSPERHGTLQGALQDFREQMRLFMSDYHVLLSPVANAPAGPHMTPEDIAKLPAGEFLNLARRAMGGFYLTHNLTGWPAAVVRAGTSPEGLPIGVQIAANPWREDVALAVAKVIEERCGGWQPPEDL